MKCLLGDAHYKRYRAIRADVLKKIKSGVKNAEQNEHLVLLMTKISKFLSSFIRINLQEN